MPNGTLTVLCLVFGCVLVFGIGFLASRYRWYAAASILSALMVIIPIALAYKDYEGTRTFLQGLEWSALLILPCAAISVGLMSLGYLVGTRVACWQRPLNSNWHFVIIAVTLLPLVFFMLLDFIPPSKATLANKYEMLLSKQATILEGQLPSYNPESTPRHPIMHAVQYFEITVIDQKFYVEAVELFSGDYGIVSDIYDERREGSLSPVVNFSRSPNTRFVDIDVRGAFLLNNNLYYNYGKIKSVAKYSGAYDTQDYRFAKIDFSSLQDIQISKNEYEQAYDQVHHELS